MKRISRSQSPKLNTTRYQNHESNIIRLHIRTITPTKHFNEQAQTHIKVSPVNIPRYHTIDSNNAFLRNFIKQQGCITHRIRRTHVKTNKAVQHVHIIVQPHPNNMAVYRLTLNQGASFITGFNQGSVNEGVAVKGGRVPHFPE
ncbi:GDP-mannose dehydrase [Striga asiatica]|uniref:GDP-mannose dehydrase n=1 Tax=Striga asiatica TaxID=4170 RepID=A0A5A7P3G2_STRAF|nr:GDP-mannose dehydrase [Striga asiatica]